MDDDGGEHADLRSVKSVLARPLLRNDDLELEKLDWRDCEDYSRFGGSERAAELARGTSRF